MGNCSLNSNIGPQYMVCSSKYSNFRVLDKEFLRLNVLLFASLIAMAYLGRAKAEWSMVILPDTQNYHVNYPFWLPLLYAQTQWAVDNKEEFGIELVIGTGDITSTNDPNEWITTLDVFSTLDGQLPFILPTGNHDYTPIGQYPFDGSRETTLLNDYFTEVTHPAMVEKTPGRLDNTYTRFTALDGRRMLIFSLEAVPRNEMTDWAAVIAEQYPADTVMLTTHVNMKEGPADPNGEPTSQRDLKGTELWNQWASMRSNLELIVNGHDLDGNDSDPDGWASTSRQISTGIAGNQVNEIGFNTQDAFPGGAGWLRLYTFQDDGTTVHVRTYSPYSDTWLTNNRNDFTFQLSPLGDFNRDGTVDNTDLNTWEAGYSTLYDGTDFLTWQRQFAGAAQLVPVMQVPEPASWLLFCGAVVAFWVCQERSRPRSNVLALGP